MTKSRWFSLLIVVPYVLSVVFSPIWRNPWDGGSWMYL